MADVRIYRLQFLQNNPLGTFLQYDVLEAYYDDTNLATNYNPVGFEATGITIKLNGSPITSGPFFYNTPEYVSVEFDLPKVCNGTDLVKFNQISWYPYAFYYSIPDSFECAIAPQTCDLIVVGNPEVTYPTTTTSTDGEIVINAQSTYSIEYKLNEDFVYGTGQSSNTFSGLRQGGYRVYLRDEKNCGANVFVQLNYSGNYGIHYQLTYYGLFNIPTKIDILERDYASSIVEYKGTDKPLQINLRGEASTNKFTPVLSTEVVLGLMSETDSQWVELYTNDPDKYRVKIYKDTGGGWELKTVTKLLPFVFEEEHYNGFNYDVYVSSTDGLSELKEYDFVQNDGLRLNGIQKLIKIIAYCLSFTRLNLQIRVACNMYATGMTSAASDDPLDQAYVDLETFYLNGGKCSDVLMMCLEPFGARLVQWNGVWNIVRVEEMSASYDYRQFDVNGDYVSHGTFDPVLDIGPNGDVRFTNPGNLELQAGYGKITVNYDLGYKQNFLKNGDFSLVNRFNPDKNTYDSTVNLEGFTLNAADYPVSQTYENIDENNIALVIDKKDDGYVGVGSAYLTSAPYNVYMAAGNSILIKIRYKVSIPSSGPNINISVPYVKVRIKVTYGAYYLQGDGNWTINPTYVTFFPEKAGEYVESEIKAAQPLLGTPEEGMTLRVTLYHAHPYYADYRNYVDITENDGYGLKGLATTDLPLGYKTEIYFNDTYDAIYYYELAEITEDELLYIKEGQVINNPEDYDDPGTFIGDIIRPNDYDASTNPVQWIKKYSTLVDPLNGKYPFAVDYIQCKFLTSGEEPISVLTRSIIGEKNNPKKYSQNLYIGSSGNTITTETTANFDFDLNRFIYPTGLINWNTIKTNVLSDEIIFSGYLRKSDGTRLDYWTRDGKNESDFLHHLWLKMFASQYKTSWRLLRRSLISETSLITPLNSYRDVNDNNRVYIPISLSLDDKQNTASMELLELTESDCNGDFDCEQFSTAFNI